MLFLGYLKSKISEKFFDSYKKELEINHSYQFWKDEKMQLKEIFIILIAIILAILMIRILWFITTVIMQILIFLIVTYVIYLLLKRIII